MKAHRLNREFTWRQPDAPFSFITEDQATAFRRDGGFVLKDAFTAEELAPLIRDLDRLEAAMNERVRAQASAQRTIARADEIVFSPHAVMHSETARAFSRHPVFKALCRDLIGPRVRLYWDQLVYKRPGTKEEFPWHQDNGYTYVEPQQYLTCWVALSDATVENGCPWIAPGVHLGGTLHHDWTPLGFRCLETVEDAVAMPLAAGSVAVFSSLTPHRTGPNLSQDLRRAYILQYAPDGAQIHTGQGEVVSADDPDRQYCIVEDAAPC